MESFLEARAEKRNKRVVVVLGMHRSGTSAITRGLQALGVNLGQRLLPSQPENPKGFWEDIDINALNIELQAALGQYWHSFGNMGQGLVDRSRWEPFVDRAKKLLHEKMAETDIFGVKDPRMCRLLPFWQSIFQELELEDSYVLVRRHPLSVAKSLKQRDGFEPEKCLYLWLEHMVMALVDTRARQRVVVDYDAVLADPRGQLQRIAKTLNLQQDVEVQAVENYVKNFLAPDLRHTVYTASDLIADSTIPSGVVATYTSLGHLTDDCLAGDAAEVEKKIQSIRKQWQEFFAAFAYMNKQDNALIWQQAEMARLRQAMEKR